MVLGVKHFVADSPLGKERRKLLGLLDGYGAHQHRLPFCMGCCYIITDSLELIILVKIDLIIHIIPDYRAVCGKDNYIQVVDLCKLPCLGVGSTGHT